MRTSNQVQLSYRNFKEEVYINGRGSEDIPYIPKKGMHNMPENSGNCKNSHCQRQREDSCILHFFPQISILQIQLSNAFCHKLLLEKYILVKIIVLQN